MYLRVHVIPGAKKEALTKEGPDVLRVSVREPARNNLANRRVLEVVARHIGCPPSEARIISGHRSPTKMVVVPDNINPKPQTNSNDQNKN